MFKDLRPEDKMMACLSIVAMVCGTILLLAVIICNGLNGVPIK